MSKYHTEQRRILINFFKDSNHRTLTAQEIHDELVENNISMSAIYRNLAELENQGLICKVAEKGCSSALYQYIDPDECVGVIHLKCMNCKATFHMNRHISQMVIGIADDDYNFRVKDTAAILYGECDTCSQKI